MDMVSCDSTVLVMLNSAEMEGRAGAIMEEETGEMKAKAEMMRIAAHLRPLGLG